MKIHGDGEGKQQMGKSSWLFMIFWILIMVGIPYESAQATHIQEENTENQLKPLVVLVSYDIGDQIITPGEEFTTTLLFRNTNAKTDVCNVIISFTEEDNLIFPVDDETNQIFIEEIKAGESVKVEVDLIASEYYNMDIAHMNFKFQYQDYDLKVYNDQSEIPFSLMSDIRLEVLSLSSVDATAFGSKSLVSVNLMNSGKEDIQNIIMRIQGDILKDQKKVVLEDMLAGEKQYLDHYINFKSLGEQTISISFTYENKKGDLFSLGPEEYVIRVEEVGENEQEQTQDGTESSGENQGLFALLRLFLVMGGAAIMIMVVLIVAKHLRTKDSHFSMK